MRLNLFVKLKYLPSTVTVDISVDSNILRLTYFVTSLTMSDRPPSDMRHMVYDVIAPSGLHAQFHS